MNIVFDMPRYLMGQTEVDLSKLISNQDDAKILREHGEAEIKASCQAPEPSK